MTIPTEKLSGLCQAFRDGNTNVEMIVRAAFEFGAADRAALVAQLEAAEREAADEANNAARAESCMRDAEAACSVAYAEAERWKGLAHELAHRACQGLGVSEKLTDDERVVICGGPSLATLGDAGTKALRIIDAHAADRAALVAQVAELQRSNAAGDKLAEGWCDKALAAEAQVAELTRERDEARDRIDILSAHVERFESEVTHLTEALAAAERKQGYRFCLECQARAEVAEARVRELEESNDCFMRSSELSLKDAAAAESECAALRAEVRRATEALNTERAARVEQAQSIIELRAANASLGEGTLRARAEVERLGGMLAHESEVAMQHVEACLDAESRLAAANALLKLAKDGMYDDLVTEIRAHLAAQPATAPARTEAEQRVLEACSVAFLVDGVHPRFAYDGCAETVARAELARREQVKK